MNICLKSEGLTKYLHLITSVATQRRPSLYNTFLLTVLSSDMSGAGTIMHQTSTTSSIILYHRLLIGHTRITHEYLFEK